MRVRGRHHAKVDCVQQQRTMPAHVCTKPMYGVDHITTSAPVVVASFSLLQGWTCLMVAPTGCQAGCSRRSCPGHWAARSSHHLRAACACPFCAPALACTPHPCLQKLACRSHLLHCRPRNHLPGRVCVIDGVCQRQLYFNNANGVCSGMASIALCHWWTRRCHAWTRHCHVWTSEQDIDHTN